MSKKFNMNDVSERLKKKFSSRPELSAKIGLGTNLKTISAENSVPMPGWFEKVSGVSGIPYGQMVMIAGDSDSGKTSAAIEAMKSAQSQGCGVIYVETEGKTSEQDLKKWGVDTSNVLLIQSSIAEEAFQLLFEAWDTYLEMSKDTPLLIVYDSIGNQVSMRDADIDLVEASSKPGGKGAINRLALNKMVAKRDKSKTAIMILNYTYDNIGSVGKTNAGGKAINFFSSFTVQTSRKSWYEKTVKGEKVRAGAVVTWRVFKNHLSREHQLKQIDLKITSEGITVLGEE